MKRRILELDKKIKIIEYTNKNLKMGCRVIGNTSIRVSNILRNAKNLLKEYEFFKRHCKKFKPENTTLLMKF